MNVQEAELKIKELEAKLASIDVSDILSFQQIKLEIEQIKKEAYSNLSAWDRVCLARSLNRPKASDYIRALFDEFYEMHGDYLFSDDESIIGGIASFMGIPVTVLAQAKGKTVSENVKRNFGSTNPEGFRKTLRLAKQADKFNRPIITIVDTSGAFPGKGAEERGQSRAIAQNLLEFAKIKSPIIAIVIGEGGSGGALALSVANKILMLENAVYSILSPEGFSSILFKDASRVKEAAEKMKLTANDLLEAKVVDYVVKEPLGGAQNDFEFVISQIKKIIMKELDEYSKVSSDDIITDRYLKFRNIGLDLNE